MTSHPLLIMALALLLLAPEAARAQLNLNGGNLSMRDFVLLGKDPKGQTWNLHGKRTRKQGTMVNIDGLQLRFNMRNLKDDKQILGTDEQQNTQVILKSEFCQFNSATREIKSEAAIAINIGKNIYVTGIGYDIDIDKKVILLRSAVTVTMKNLPKQLTRKRK